jgi:putative FmdB family regulatory protein
MTHLVPIYVYKCDNGHTFEAMQSMSEDPLDTCEVCGAAARRQLVAPAVHFKGSGFYTTDYARKGAAKSGGNGGGESKGDSSGSKSSDSGSKSEGKTASSKD